MMNASATTLAMVTKGSASCLAVSQVQSRQARRTDTQDQRRGEPTANKHDVPDATYSRLSVKGVGRRLRL